VFTFFFCHHDDAAEQFFFVGSENLAFGEFILATAAGDGTDGHHGDVVTAQIRFLQHTAQMFHAAEIAHRDQYAARSRFQVSGFNLRLMLQIELLQPLLASVTRFRIVADRNCEHDEEKGRKSDTKIGRNLFGKQVRDRDEKED